MAGLLPTNRNSPLLNWRLRLWLLKNVFGRSGGQTVYRLLQRWSPFHKSPARFRKKRDQILRLVDMAERAGTRIDGSTIVEIGTGWIPLLPFIMWLLGAKKVYTIDLNRHLMRPVACRILTWLVNDEASLNELRTRSQTNLFDERVEQLRRWKDPMAFFDTAEIIYQAPADARCLALPDSSVDLICSNVTFEHVPGDVLQEIFAETVRVLKPDGCAVHCIDLSDHCSHTDHSISSVNFLRFTDQEWQRMAGQGIAYHNRLRVPEYESIVKSVPLVVELLEGQVDDRALEDLPRFTLGKDRWSQYSQHELATRSLSLVARPVKVKPFDIAVPKDDLYSERQDSTWNVTLIIPGRNCASTLDSCLSSVVPLKESGQLKEIIFVDDGSTDTTPEIAARYAVRVIQGTGQGPGAARNLGWQAAETDLIWFIDSDCVAEPDALQKLLPHMKNPDVAGVGGSYANLFPESLVATLIHEEIVARHRRMKREVDFLATFNVIYRRSVLAELGGFNEELKLAQDAELAYRVRAAGHRLNFELQSRVGHHHPRSLWRYLKTQARQGYYRIKLYRQHPTKISGDSYAGMLDYVQPPLALLTCVALAGTLMSAGKYVFAVLLIALLITQLPMTWRLLRQHHLRMLHFIWFGSVRALARAIGLAKGIFELAFGFMGSKETNTVVQLAASAGTSRSHNK